MRVVIRDIHTVKVKGRTYYYHRPTKTRLRGEPGSPEFMADLAKVAEKPAAGQPGTFRELVDIYRQTPEFKGLAPRTRADYRKVLDYLDTRIGDWPVEDVTAPELVDVRDGVAAKRNWRFANYCLAVISRVFSIAVLRGRAKANPAIGVPKLTRPREAPPANRSWTDGELAAVLAAAPAGVALAVALGAYTGLRQGDVLRLPWSAYDGHEIALRQGKTGESITLPVHRRLRAALKAAKRTGPVMVTGKRGRPYTSDGFRTMLDRLIRDLEAKRAVGEGLTFHGLRHSLATRLADAGADDRTITAWLGWTSPAMAQRYTKRADQKKRARAGLRLIK